MEKLFTTEEEKEMQDIIIWAISEGYLTNDITKKIIYKLNVNKDILGDLDKNCNVGVKITE